MKATATAAAPGVVVPGSLAAAVQQVEQFGADVQTHTQTIRTTLERFQAHMRQALTDPRTGYELALCRLKETVRQGLDAITTRCGRDYLLGHTRDTSAPSVSVILAAQHMHPRWHQHTAERVTCLRAPRADLPLAAA